MGESFATMSCLNVCKPTRLHNTWLHRGWDDWSVHGDVLLWQAVVDEQWVKAMEYVNSVSELNYMTQIVIMLYEDPTKVWIIWLTSVTLGRLCQRYLNHPLFKYQLHLSASLMVQCNFHWVEIITTVISA